jgi:hypothetical protein
MLEGPDDSFLKSWSRTGDAMSMVAAALFGSALKSVVTYLTSRVTDPPVSRLAEILEAYSAVFERVAKKGWKPVLVVDAANVLACWRPDHSAALKQLFDFFTANTKQAGRSHVILATSDYGFIDVVEQSRCFARTCTLL